MVSQGYFMSTDSQIVPGLGYPHEHTNLQEVELPPWDGSQLIPPITQHTPFPLFMRRLIVQN